MITTEMIANNMRPRGVKPLPWKVVPELTSAPDLWANVTFLLPMWDPVPQDVSRNGHRVSIGDASPSLVSTAHGWGTKPTTSNQEFVITDKGLWDNTDYHTVFGVALYRERYNEHLLNWGSTTAGSLIVRSGDQSNNRVDFVFRDNAGAATVLSTTTNSSLLSGEAFVFVARIKDGAQTLFVQRITGGEAWSNSGTISLSGGTKSGAGDFYIQNHPSATSAYQQALLMVGHAHAYWGDAQAKKFLFDPFAMIRPRVL